jgi:hypothetical protein
MSDGVPEREVSFDLRAIGTISRIKSLTQGKWINLESFREKKSLRVNPETARATAFLLVQRHRIRTNTLQVRREQSKQPGNNRSGRLA